MTDGTARAMKPHVSKTISLDAVPYAHFKLEQNNCLGLITLDPWA